MLGGGGSPLKPLTADAGSDTVLHGMDGVVVNQSLLELAAAGQSGYISWSSLLRSIANIGISTTG